MGSDMHTITEEELARLRLCETILRGVTTHELRVLAAAAIETHDGMRQGLPPLPWHEIKDRLLDAAVAFAKAARENT